ncbi:MAG: TolC family protein [Nitrospirota bacterium]
MKTIFLLVLAILLLPFHANAGMNISIQDTIALALENNLDIKIEKFNPDIRKTETEKERSIFDPVFTSDFINSATRTPSSSELEGAREIDQKVLDFSIGLTQKFVTGTSAELKFINERYRSNSIFLKINPYYESDVTLTLTQPLLKDFGPNINLTRIRIAENNENISGEQLKLKIIEVISNSKRAYWNLLLNIEELEVRKFSLNLAKDLLERNRKKVEVGVLAPIELIQAEAGVASREEAVFVAEKAVRDAEDAVKRITGLTKEWEKVLIPVDKPIISKERLHFDESKRIAFESRPDYLQANKDLENKAINIRYTKNQTLPELSFVGGIGLNGLNSSYSSDLKGLRSGDFYSWKVGLSLAIPIGNRSARSDYLKARLEEEKARVELKNLEEAIIVEIRVAIREIDTTHKRIDATRSARILAEKKLEAEEKKFNVGMSTSHDILIFQEELANALRNEKKAMIDHNNALINLEKVTGITIEKAGIVF